MDGLQAPPAQPGTAPTGDDTDPDRLASPPRAPRDAEGSDTVPGAEALGTDLDLRPSLYRLMVVGAVAVVVLGIALRFVASSHMWLDEALTPTIARLPLGKIDGALRRDGAPPLYYYLLHFWTGAFGTSDTAVRALSGVLG